MGSSGIVPLLRHGSLLSLRADWCNLEVAGQANLPEGAPSATLETISLDDCRALAPELQEAILKLPSLKTVSLRQGSYVGTEFLKQLISKPTLEYLDASGCSLACDTLVDTTVSTRLCYLALCRTTVTDADVCHVAKTCPLLATLALSDCLNLTGGAVKELLKLPLLTELYIDSAGICDDVAAIVAGKSTLRRVVVNWMWSNESIELIRAKLPNCAVGQTLPPD